MIVRSHALCAVFKMLRNAGRRLVACFAMDRDDACGFLGFCALWIIPGSALLMPAIAAVIFGRQKGESPQARFKLAAAALAVGATALAVGAVGIEHAGWSFGTRAPLLAELLMAAFPINLALIVLQGAVGVVALAAWVAASAVRASYRKALAECLADATPS